MTTINTTLPDLATDHYELALAMRERAAGFAFLLRSAAEQGAVSDLDLMGIARLAEDMSAKAAELLEATRAQEWAIDRRGQ